MRRPTQLESAYKQIESFFERLPQKAFTKNTLSHILEEHRQEWGMGNHQNVNRLTDFLVSKGDLHVHIFRDTLDHNKEIYSWRTQDEFTIMTGLKTSGYFTFYSAIFLHGLTLQIPKTHYLNFERSSASGSDKAGMTQNAIDKAFSKPQAKSESIYSWGNISVVITNGKNTKNLGVIEQNDEDKAFAYTNLERTLIDIAVRPAYAGGVFEVLEAYTKAMDQLNVDKLEEYLHTLNYTYPYHQVIGFYLQKAGYSAKAYKRFHRDRNYKFYLTYNIRSPVFSTEWNLYYPAGF